VWLNGRATSEESSELRMMKHGSSIEMLSKTQNMGSHA